MKIRLFRLCFALGLTVLTFTLAVIAHTPGATRAQTPPNDQMGTGQVIGVQPHFTQGMVLSQPPPRSAAEIARQERAWAEIRQARDSYRVPTDPSARVSPAPANPPTQPPAPTTGAADEVLPKAPSAPGDFVLYRNSKALCAPAGCVFRNPNEPTSGANGRMVLMTANTYGVLSGDYGQTWVFVDPLTSFPNAAGGAIGDFIAYHDQSHNMTVWYLQYARDASNNNIVRLAIATSQSNLANNAWHYYDFSAQQFGYGTGWWLDYPDLSAGGSFAYVTSNICFNTGPGNCRNAIVMRLSLDAMAAGQALSFNYFTSTLISLRGAVDLGGPAYFGTHVDNNTIRVWTWREINGTPESVDRDVNTWQNGASTANSPDGTNWLAGDNHRIIAAFVTGTRLGFMWDSAQGGGYTHPNVRYARFNTSDSSLADEGVIWSSDIAWGYPSGGSNRRGDAAGTIHYGGSNGGVPGTQYPTLGVWIADGFNGDTIAPATLLFVAGGNIGSNRWGNYNSTRSHSMYDSTWVGTGYVMRSTVTGQYEPHHVWFGREQDRPPANNTIFVSRFYSGQAQTGSILGPYKSVFAGNFACMPGDTLSIVVANYNETGVMNRACILKAFSAGTVVIGRP